MLVLLQDSHSDKGSSISLLYHYFSLINIKNKGCSAGVMHQMKFNVFYKNVSVNLNGFWIKFYLLVMVIQAPHLPNTKRTLMINVVHY